MCRKLGNYLLKVIFVPPTNMIINIEHNILLLLVELILIIKKMVM